MELRYDHLVGKPFIFGEHDCLSLFRQFYADNFDIHITNYARPSGWSSDQLDLMRLCYEREGFEMVSEWKEKDLRPGDVLCMAIGESKPNHFAIYVGESKIVHHLAGRISRVDEWRDFFRQTTCYVLRHPAVPDMRPVYPNVTIEELLRERYQVGSADPA